METIFHREKGFKELYPDLPTEKVRQAELYLSLLKEGTVKSGVMQKEEILDEFNKLHEGTLSESAIIGHADNYYFYLHPDEQQ